MDSHPEQTRGGSTAAAWIIGGLALLYFGFPHLLIFPLTLVWGKSTSSFPSYVTEPLGLAFTPVRLLADRIPAYRAVLDWESEVTGIE